MGAVFDLNEELKLIKKELSDLEQQIISTDSKIKLNENNLKQSHEEKKKVLDSLKREKIILEKSLKSELGENEMSEFREFWMKHSVKLKEEIKTLKTKNMAASASADVMHKHLRSQLEQTRRHLSSKKEERQQNKNKNMQFELEVIELTDLVNSLKENVDAQRHENFLKLNKNKL